MYAAAVIHAGPMSSEEEESSENETSNQEEGTSSEEEESGTEVEEDSSDDEDEKEKAALKKEQPQEEPLPPLPTFERRKRAPPNPDIPWTSAIPLSSELDELQTQIRQLEFQREEDVGALEHQLELAETEAQENLQKVEVDMKATIEERDKLLKERDDLASQLRKLERQERDMQRKLTEQEWRWEREREERKNDELSMKNKAIEDAKNVDVLKQQHSEL